MKKIIHIDMDAYFAAIEIRENPSLKGKCVIVGGPPNSRGVVSTCSYEARKYGVRSGMPSHQAWQLCPKGVFVFSNFELYKSVAKQVQDIFYRYTDVVEIAGLDEAYLDVTENKLKLDSAEEVAKRIKEDVFKETQLTCSAGVSYNKFLAKIASDYQKPDGLTVIDEKRAREVLFALPIEKFHGIGKVTAARLKKLGITNGAELYELSLMDLVKHFGKVGHFYYFVVRGIDKRELITDWEPKTISCENTYAEDIGDLSELLGKLKNLAERLSERMMRKGITGKQINIKIKYDNFEVITRSCQCPESLGDEHSLYHFGEKLLISNWDSKRKVRLLGLGVGCLDNQSDEEQLQLRL